jgi:aspartate ammonia-lyase
MAAEAGQLQLNAIEPIIAHCLFQSLTHLDAACQTLVHRCISGITANRERLYESVTNSIGVITALSPYIGYAASARIAKMALRTARSIPELVVEDGLLTAAQVDRLLAPEALIRPSELISIDAAVEVIPEKKEALP